MLSPAVKVPVPERRSPFHSAVPFAGMIALLQFETLLHVGVPSRCKCCPKHRGRAMDSGDAVISQTCPSDSARADRFYKGDTGCLEAVEHQSHGHRALADGRRHPRDRSAADIADTEDPGPARLEQQGHVLNALELSHWNVGASEHE